MAALDLDEQEQLDQIKTWLKEYGPSILIGIVIAVILFFGWQRYTFTRERAMDHASVRYEQLLDYLAANNKAEADKAADYLIRRYPKSAYAKLANLLLARRDIDNQDYAAAQTKLTDVMESADIPAIREVARLRLARLQIAQKQPDAALKSLSKLEDQHYLAMAAAVKGDAYTALNNSNAARAAYQQALAGLPQGAMLGNIISMKLSNLPA